MPSGTGPAGPGSAWLFREVNIVLRECADQLVLQESIRHPRLSCPGMVRFGELDRFVPYPMHIAPVALQAIDRE